MSDIRFNRWLHNSGTGGVTQDSSGNIGIGSSVPRTALDVVGIVSATSFSGALTGNVTGNATGLSGTPNITVGSITASSATISGNVSVAGTVTYDDVTNVDSVGLVTARTGVRIDAGGLVVVGVTTVAAGSTAAPSITPTGDSNTGIFFPAADTIAFGEGGTEALRIDSSGGVSIGAPNTSDASLTCGANATGNRYAYIDLVGDTTYTDFGFRIIRNNAGPNTDTALFHRGTGDLAISCVDAGQISFRTSGTERLKVDSSGRVTMPFQPSFRVGRSTNYNPGANTDIIFNVVSTHHHNTGNHYNTSNGRFNVPVTGKYLISFEIVWQDIPNNATMEDACYIFVNGAGAMFSFSRGFYVSGITGGSGYYVDFGTCILSLNATDYVTIRNHRNYTVHGNSLYTWFAGHLLG